MTEPTFRASIEDRLRTLAEIIDDLPVVVPDTEFHSPETTCLDAVEELQRRVDRIEALERERDTAQTDRYDEIADLRKENATLRADLARVREALTTLVKDVDGLISDSQGVYGLHLNGDVAPWDSLTAGGQFEDWLSSLEAARAALASTFRPTHRHVKRGTEYAVIAVAELQMGRDLVDGAELQIYVGADGKWWARSTDEFYDGRFVPIAPDAAKEPSP